jgi:beta-glucosidase
MTRRLLTLLLVGLLWHPSSSGAQQSDSSVWPVGQPAISTDPQLEDRVAALVSKMSLEEKAAQMIQAEIQHVSPAEAAAYGLGSVLNGGGSFPDTNKRATVRDWVELSSAFQKAMRARAGVAIPLIWGTDAVHGHNNVFGATLFPHNIGIGAGRDLKLAHEIAIATAREVRATGIHWVFAPTLAVARDPRWGRTYESFSSDPDIVQKFGEAYVTGLQGPPNTPGFLRHDTVLATAKHFIGDGGTTFGIDQGNTELDDADLMRLHTPGYYAAIAAGVQTVMVSFSSVNGQKLHGHRRLITDILKDRMRFDGLVVSDWNGIGQVPGCTNTNCPQAINAGIDMIMAPEEWRELHRNIVSQVKGGLIPLQRIDDAVTRILRVKARYGLLSDADPKEASPDELQSTVIGSEAHRALARDAVRKSLVLIKNSQQTLPLAATARVWVIGAAADDVGRQSGGWTLTWQGSGNERADFPGATSIFEGLQTALRAGGGDAIKIVEDMPAEKPDALVVVVGEEPYAEGEGDLESLDFESDAPVSQMIAKMQSDGVPVITIFVSGRPRVVNSLINASTAFVAAWLPGSEGAGIADVLVGQSTKAPRFDFQGRLPFEWPLSYSNETPEVNPRSLRPLPVGYGLTYGMAGSQIPDLLPEPTSREAGEMRPLRIFDRRPVAPNQMFVGDRGNWRLPVTGPVAKSSEGIVALTTIDRLRQGDARQITWQGRGEGLVYFETTTPRDLRDWVARGAALALDLKVERAPTRSTFVKAQCKYPCGSEANITTALRKAPKNEWFRLSIDLACFVKSGLDPSKVTTLPLLSTSGELSMSISNVRLIPDLAANATVSCSGR